MATLSDAASTNLAWVIRYITESNGLEKPNFDIKAIETLARDYAEYGYARQIQFLEDFRDRPFWALTNVILYLDTVAPVLTAEERAQVQVAADTVKTNFSPGEATYQAFLNFIHIAGAGAASDVKFLTYIKDRPLITLLLFILAFFASDAATLDVARLGILSDLVTV